MFLSGFHEIFQTRYATVIEHRETIFAYSIFWSQTGNSNWIKNSNLWNEGEDQCGFVGGSMYHPHFFLYEYSLDQRQFGVLYAF